MPGEDAVISLVVEQVYRVFTGNPEGIEESLWSGMEYAPGEEVEIPISIMPAYHFESAELEQFPDVPVSYDDGILHFIMPEGNCFLAIKLALNERIDVQVTFTKPEAEAPGLFDSFDLRGDSAGSEHVDGTSIYSFVSGDFACGTFAVPRGYKSLLVVNYKDGSYETLLPDSRVSQNDYYDDFAFVDDDLVSIEIVGEVAKKLTYEINAPEGLDAHLYVNEYLPDTVGPEVYEGDYVFGYVQDEITYGRSPRYGSSITYLDGSSPDEVTEGMYVSNYFIVEDNFVIEIFEKTAYSINISLDGLEIPYEWAAIIDGAFQVTPVDNAFYEGQVFMHIFLMFEYNEQPLDISLYMGDELVDEKLGVFSGATFDFMEDPLLVTGDITIKVKLSSNEDMGPK